MPKSEQPIPTSQTLKLIPHNLRKQRPSVPNTKIKAAEDGEDIPEDVEVTEVEAVAAAVLAKDIQNQNSTRTNTAPGVKNRVTISTSAGPLLDKEKVRTLEAMVQPLWIENRLRQTDLFNQASHALHTRPKLSTCIMYN